MAEELHPPISEDERFVTIPLFESAHAGFGDAQEVQDFRYNRIHGSIDPRWPGQIRAGLQVQSIANANWDYPPVFAAEWFDTTGINPKIDIIVQDEIWGLRFGSLAQTDTADLLGERARTAMIHNDGAGVPLIYVGFGDTALGEQNIRSVTRWDVGGDPTVTAASGTLRSAVFASLNGRAYRAFKPSGGQAACQVSTLPVGSDPMTAANWGGGQTVGFAHTSITAIIGVRHQPITIKPEGIFMYNRELDRWINQTPGWANFTHQDTGRGAFSLGNNAVIPLGDGGAVLFDGWNVTEFDPAGFAASPNVHTTPNRIDSLGNLKYWVVGATSPRTKEISAGSSLRVWHFDAGGSTYTDGSGDLRDGSLATSESWTIDATGDFIYIGWTRPFAAVAVDFSTVQTTARTVTAAVSDGSTGFNAIAVRDFTSLAGASFGQSGRIVMTADPVATQSWLPDTVNSVSGLYWLRLNWSGAFSGAAVAVSVRIQPWHPSVDATNFPADGMDRSGTFPHIIYGTKDRPQNLWHDMVSLPEPDEIGAVLYANVGGTSLNRYRNLLAIGRFRIWRIDVTESDHPGTEEAPFINDVGLIESSSMIPVQGKLCRLVGVKIGGIEGDPNLVGRLYYTWDYGKPWNKAATVQRFPGQYEINQPTKGYRIRWAWGWSQSSDTALLTQPAMTEIEATFEVLGDALDQAQDRALASEPRI